MLTQCRVSFSSAVGDWLASAVSVERAMSSSGVPMGCRRGEVDAGRGEARHMQEGQVEVPAVNRLSQALSLHRAHHASSLDQRTGGPYASSDLPLVIEGTCPWRPLAAASSDLPSSVGTGRPPPLNEASRGSPMFSPCAVVQVRNWGRRKQPRPSHHSRYYRVQVWAAQLPAGTQCRILPRHPWGRAPGPPPP
jgi:hypothetical protein